MISKYRLKNCLIALSAISLLGSGIALSVHAQTAPKEGDLKQARQAVEVRKAVFTLIGSNFQPLGNILKGTVPYDSGKVKVNVARLAVLSEFVNDIFPDYSNLGEPETKTKADAWTNKEDLLKRIADFQAHAQNLVKVSATEGDATDAFKAAVTAVGQDCKGCHDLYKAK